MEEDKDGSTVIATSVLVNCLKLFQENPSRFPLDLRAKFCGCSGTKGKSSVCAEYVKEKQMEKKLKKIPRHESGEFVSTATDANSDLEQLKNIAEELKEILKDKLKDHSVTSVERKAKIDSDRDILQTIDYLITHPEKIPIEAANKLCQIAASLSQSKPKSKRIPRKSHRTDKDSIELFDRFFKMMEIPPLHQILYIVRVQ